LIIDGKSLDYSLNKNLERSFFELATNCASVICCRSSPKQKARVSTMVVVCVLLPYFSFSSFQSRFLPIYHDITQKENK